MDAGRILREDWEETQGDVRDGFNSLEDEARNLGNAGRGLGEDLQGHFRHGEPEDGDVPEDKDLF